MSDYTLDDFIVSQAVTNSDILAYATSHVNLPLDQVKKYRERANSLRDRLERYIKDHPDYDLVKMLHSGSLAKGTALRRLNDIDTAIYVKSAAVGDVSNAGLIAWLRDRLVEVFPNFRYDQLEAQAHCVTVHYKSGLNVDVVPVLYEGGADNLGYLVTNTGDRVLTSISLHIQFLRKRKQAQPDHYAQFVRLVKWWISNQKRSYKDAGGHFRFKSLMAELICAKLADDGLDTSNYADALQKFFAYVVKSDLKEPIIFNDYYRTDSVELVDSEVMHIYDPVNSENNIARTYTEDQRQQIVTEAQKALEAIVIATTSTTKGEAVTKWQTVLGPTFTG